MHTCVLFLVCPLPCVLCSLLRLTVLLPALPDVYLSAQREVQVQPPVRLPLGDRGHIRLRDTPHKRQRLESKHPRTNRDVRSSKLTKGSHVTSEVQKRDTQKALKDRSAIMCIFLMNVVSAYVLCHVCAQIFFVVLGHFA